MGRKQELRETVPLRSKAWSVFVLLKAVMKKIAPSEVICVSANLSDHKQQMSNMKRKTRKRRQMTDELT